MRNKINGRRGTCHVVDAVLLHDVEELVHRTVEEGAPDAGTGGRDGGARSGPWTDAPAVGVRQIGAEQLALPPCVGGAPPPSCRMMDHSAGGCKTGGTFTPVECAHTGDWWNDPNGGGGVDLHQGFGSHPDAQGPGGAVLRQSGDAARGKGEVEGYP